jgi:hypothetical protein
MTKLIKISLSLILGICVELNAQNSDSNLVIKENLLPIEGMQYITLKVDNSTPLNDLIQRLNTNWKFIETGKAYWIGFTEDMFSISSRGDVAIQKLVSFFKQSANLHGKEGVIYTLYLIGINRKVYINEEFTNAKAREALFELLNEKEHVDIICKLLSKDPRNSDIGKLFDFIQAGSNKNLIWPVLNYLAYIGLDNKPLCNKVPDSIMKLEVYIGVGNKRLHKNDFNGQTKHALKLLSDEFPKTIIVERKLYRDSLIGNDFWGMYGWVDAKYFVTATRWSRFYYYYGDNKLVFITVDSAREKLLNWWTSLPADDKKKYE